MNWPTLEALQDMIPLPVGYRFALCHRAHIAPLIAAIKQWHPAISVGAGSVYLREEFYLQKVCLDGHRWPMNRSRAQTTTCPPIHR